MSDQDNFKVLCDIRAAFFRLNDLLGEFVPESHQTDSASRDVYTVLDAFDKLEQSHAEVERLRGRCEEAEIENERVRKANLDCVAWEKACKADLDRALARVAEVESKYQELLAEKNFIGRKGLKALFLRKQTEAVEHCLNRLRLATTAEGCKNHIQSEAQRLRQQAAESEK